MNQDVAAKAPVGADVLSLQARLDQIEAGIDAAHAKVDGMQPRTSGEGTPATEGALDAAKRCQSKLEELNQRLINVVELVGSL